MTGPLVLTVTGAVVLAVTLLVCIAMEDSSRRFHARRAAYLAHWIATHYTGTGDGPYEAARGQDIRRSS